MTARKIVYMPLDDIAPAERNAKAHDMALVRESIGRFGYIEPVVLDERTNRLVAGHGRREDLLARRDAGEPAPEGVTVKGGKWYVAVVRGWSSTDDAEAEAAGIALNQSTIAGGWDDAALASMLAELKESERGLEGLGFDLADLDALIKHVEFDARVGLQGDPDEVPEPPKVAVTKPGDLWLLGDHRLLCGDATDPAASERLLNGETVDVIWTDPPYGIDYATMNRPGKPIANDATLEQAESVLRDAMKIVRAPVSFIACSWRSLPSVLAVLAVLADLSIESKACIVWDKQRRVQNLDRYAKQHEFLVYAGPFGGEPTQDVDVWQIGRDFDPDVPTPKPVELIDRSLRTSSATSAIVFDPFAGSGSTLVAAHQGARLARLIELDPLYCDVICARFEKATGIVPRLAG